MAKYVCSKCGKRLEGDYPICPYCKSPRATQTPWMPQNVTVQAAPQGRTKYCQHCASLIDEDCIICPKCGKQVGQIRVESYQQPQVIVNNTNTNANANFNRVGGYGRPKSKWVALLLWFFLGVFGGHKFYEGKIGMGILYILTFGLFGIGLFVDLIILLFKPNPYYV